MSQNIDKNITSLSKQVENVSTLQQQLQEEQEQQRQTLQQQQQQQAAANDSSGYKAVFEQEDAPLLVCYVVLCKNYTVHYVVFVQIVHLTRNNFIEFKTGTQRLCFKTFMVLWISVLELCLWMWRKLLLNMMKRLDLGLAVNRINIGLYTVIL